jgi:hypothetical protein
MDKAVAELPVQTVGVSLLAHGSENAKSLRDEHLRGSPAYAGGDPGDHDLFAVRHLLLLLLGSPFIVSMIPGSRHGA